MTAKQGTTAMAMVVALSTTAPLELLYPIQTVLSPVHALVYMVTTAFSIATLGIFVDRQSTCVVSISTSLVAFVSHRLARVA